MLKLLIRRIFIVSIFCFCTGVSAKNVSFDFLSSSPVGSWQVREQIDTNHKGKKTGSIIRTSMISKEQRNGKPHYWIEVGMDTFKINKKGKRKTTGKRTVIKSLVPESTLTGDPANVLNNLRAFGVEMIMQSGNAKPMRISGTEGMMASAMKMSNAEIEYEFEALGPEKISVAAGEFATNKIKGSGSVDMKVVFKKVHVDSDSTMWISNKVPFGTVKTKGTAVTNNKSTTTISELMEFGVSGAKSEITKEPDDMPEIPKLGDLFGGN